jgi:hypothetical protein
MMQSYAFESNNSLYSVIKYSHLTSLDIIHVKVKRLIPFSERKGYTAVNTRLRNA